MTEQPIPESVLNAARGYMIDLRAGPHTVGNLRVIARRMADPSDLPESWAKLPDDHRVTTEMHAIVIYRAFRRGEAALAPQPEPLFAGAQQRLAEWKLRRRVEGE